MRKAFVSALCNIAQKDKRIFLLTGDLGFNVLEPFQQQFPDRFLNIGVAESNLMTVAAGLSTTGFIPFVYSIATFASMRAFEQIRSVISLQNLNVKIIAVGGGLAYTKAGPTHHSMEDITLMRALPNMTIVDPISIKQSFEVTEKIAAHKGPVYMRIERNPQIFVTNKQKFEIGKGYILKNGNDIALISTGTHVATAFAVVDLLEKKHIGAAVYSFPTIKPLDLKLIVQIKKKHKIIAVIEEHSIFGGLATEISDKIGLHILRFGLQPNYSPISSSYEKLLSYNGLSVLQITQKILKTL